MMDEVSCIITAMRLKRVSDIYKSAPLKLRSLSDRIINQRKMFAWDVVPFGNRESDTQMVIYPCAIQIQPSRPNNG